MALQENYTGTLQIIGNAALAAKRDPHDITFVCVSKGHPIEKILALYQLGARDFGENRVEEALVKKQALPADIRWHFIGTLQSKKVGKVIGLSLIHSVDSLALAQTIAAAASKQGLVQAVLLQVNVSGEATKHGMSESLVLEHFEEFLALPGLAVHGLMTMAPQYVAHTQEEEDSVRALFYKLHALQERICQRYPQVRASFNQLSMGMSQDYVVAIEAGATIVRVGSAIFS